MPVLLWLISVTSLSATSCPARAAETAKTRYAAADYLGAAAALSDVVVCTDGTDAELVDALRWLAQARAALNDSSAAVDAFALLWTMNPGYVLDPLESPKFHELYAQGRARAVKTQLAFGRFTSTVLGRVVVQVYDPHGRVKRVSVKFDEAETAAVQQPDGSWQAPLPDGARSVSFSIESAEAVVFRSMTVTAAELPMPAEELAATKPVPPPPPKTDNSKLFIVAGAAAGGVVVVAVIVTAIAVGSKRIDGSLGRIELP